MNSRTPLEKSVISALIGQVSSALQLCPPASSEQDVTTYISKPLWALWNKALGDPEDTCPTEWLGLDKTHRVYGSKTIVVDDPRLISCSLPVGIKFKGFPKEAL